MNLATDLTTTAARPRLGLVIALLAVLAGGCLIAPALAGAERSAIRGGAGMTLVFTQASAHRVGSTALVAVRCLGPRAGICNGTVTVTVGPRKRRVPFAVGGGSRQSLALPIGAPRHGADQHGFAVARTVQINGRYARDSAVLEFR